MRLKQRLLTYLLTIIPLGVILLLIIASQNIPFTKPETLTVRQVETVVLPPPPPPPSRPQSQQQEVTRSKLDLTQVANDVQLELHPIKVDLTTLKPDLNVEANIEFDLPQQEIVQEVIKTVAKFAVAELDQTPTLINTLQVPSLPRQLTRRGIKFADVILHIEIDEHGQASLRNIRKMEYLVLKPIVTKVVKSARFTAPTKEGVPVRTEFLWPVRITE